MDSKLQDWRSSITSHDERRAILDFWFDFANFFIFNSPPKVSAALNQIGYFGGILEMWREQRLHHQYPDGFLKKIEPHKEHISFLFDEQIRIMNFHFGGDPERERTAFEDFGQGVLFDDRMPVGFKVHMMDIFPVSGTTGATRGYHRWHAFIRASTLLGLVSDQKMQLDQLIGLAWAIQSYLRPKQDTHDNPILDYDKLSRLRDKWLAFSSEELDREFEKFPYPDSSVVLTPSSS